MSMSKLKDLNYQELYRLHWIEEKSLKEISVLYKVSRAAIVFHAKKLGISIRPKLKGKLCFLTYETLYQLYWTNGMTLESIGKMYGVNSGYISEHAKKLGLIVKDSNQKKSKLKLGHLTYNIFYQLYCVENKTITEIAATYKINATSIRNHAIKKLGIILREHKKLKDLTKEELHRLHWIEEKSLTKISLLYNCVPGSLRKKAKKFGIKTRDSITATKLASTGNKSHFWKGGITSLNMVIRMSPKYNSWRTACFVRDNKTCKFCLATRKELQVDHIIPFSYLLQKNNIKTLEDAMKCEELWDINNGRVLCVECHRSTDTFGNKAKNYNIFY